VTIHYPETVNLAAFVDYVSQSLGTKIIYGDELKNQTVVFRPGEVEVPKANLLDLLRSMLRMQDLALVEGDVQGWLRIVQAAEMPRHVDGIRTLMPSGPTTSNRVATQVIRVATADLAAVSKHTRQFLSSGKASVIEVPEKGLLIITDYESAIGRALDVVRLLDAEPKRVEIVPVAPRHVAAKWLAEQASKLLAEKAKLEGKPGLPVALHHDVNTNGLLLVGTAEDCASVQALLEELDSPGRGIQAPVIYSPKYISAARLARLVTHVIAAPEVGGAGEVKLHVDEETNRLFVTAPSQVQSRIQQTLESEDVPSIEPGRSDFGPVAGAPDGGGVRHGGN
jgi:type II secretory pathway component GspD/PulD (secretin)